MICHQCDRLGGLSVLSGCQTAILAVMPHAVWRPMTAADLTLVAAIAEQVHPDYPEGADVFAERLRLFGRTCLMLEHAGQPVGYAIGHPWVLREPPKLNVLLRRLPLLPDTMFIHDLALLPVARCKGHGAEAVHWMVREAVDLDLPTLSLVAVGGSARFWRRLEFRPSEDAGIQNGLKSYGPGACAMVRFI